MNCSNCQKELPEDYGGIWCPYCGKDLITKTKSLRNLTGQKFHWLVFLAALLLPALFSLLSASTMRLWILSNPINEGVSLWVAVIGSVIGGVICGVLLGIQGSQKLFLRILISIFMSAIMIVVCVVLCFFGCNVGGYQMKIGG